MNSDIIIFGGMALAVSAGGLGCFYSRLIFARLGFVLSILASCVGLAYFGWRPLFGGTQSPDAIFGGLALLLGLFGFCLFGAIDEILRGLTSKADQGRGFPVITGAPKNPG